MVGTGVRVSRAERQYLYSSTINKHHWTIGRFSPKRRNDKLSTLGAKWRLRTGAGVVLRILCALLGNHKVLYGPVEPGWSNRNPVMASVRASKRVSISWDGGEPFEDTDTLVLTIDGFSLDLRVFNSGPQNGNVDWSTVAKVTETEGSTPGQWSIRGVNDFAQ